MGPWNLRSLLMRLGLEALLGCLFFRCATALGLDVLFRACSSLRQSLQEEAHVRLKLSASGLCSANIEESIACKHPLPQPCTTSQSGFLAICTLGCCVEAWRCRHGATCREVGHTQLRKTTHGWWRSASPEQASGILRRASFNV